MDKSRQQFEEWFNENGFSLGWCSKRDLEVIKNKMNKCWQASRESLEVELPKEQKAKAYDFYTDGYNSGIDCCEVILESMGIKVVRND